jgi:outer membrane protein
MRRLLLSLIISLAVPGLAAAQDAAPAAALNIGMVDLQRALNTVEEGQAARARLEEEFERRRQELETQRTEIEAFAAELEASMAMLTQEAAMERYQEYQNRVLALQEALAANEQAMAEAEANATGDIFDRMMEIVSEIAAERQFTLVVEKSTIVFAAPGLEFTDELITRYNSRY